jgi:hypothetical protein
MSNLLAHADREFAITIRNMKADPENDAGDIEMQEHMHENVREILEVVSRQGHTGFSINFLFQMVQKVGMFEPLSPILGTDDEWVDVANISGGQSLWQNARCGHVFRDGDSQAYDSTGRIIVCEDGQTVTNFQSRMPITFPYVPKRVYAPHDEDRSRFESAGIVTGDYATADEVRELYKVLKRTEELREAGQAFVAGTEVIGLPNVDE